VEKERKREGKSKISLIYSPSWRVTSSYQTNETSSGSKFDDGAVRAF
jgi:hypothetical protein